MKRFVLEKEGFSLAFFVQTKKQIGKLSCQSHYVMLKRCYVYHIQSSVCRVHFHSFFENLHMYTINFVINTLQLYPPQLHTLLL